MRDYIACVVECKTEKIFASTILKLNVSGCRGRSYVIKKLKNNGNIIAILDSGVEPLRKHEYLQTLINEKKELLDLGITLFFDNIKNNTMVMFNYSTFEEWLIYICEKRNIKREEYKLSEDRDKLHAFFSTENKAKTENLVALLTELDRRDVFSGLKELL